MTEAAAQSPRVLVVDDEQGILDVIRILLANNGFTPHVAHGGRAGLEQIEELRPDVVISDIRMPGVTGVEILAAARAVDAETPVILMTAQATLQSAVQAVNEGAFYYVQKPFRNDELLAIVRRAYAKQILSLVDVRDARIEAAFAQVPREHYLGPGPWVGFRFLGKYLTTPDDDPVYVYTDRLFGLIPSKGVNNGQPSLHAALMANASQSARSASARPRRCAIPAPCVLSA